MVGLIKNNEVLPYISLENFINKDEFEKALKELECYIVKQNNQNADVFIGYNGTDWQSEIFQNKQKNTLPLTTKYINNFCKNEMPFNIRYSPENNNIVLLHQDDAAQLNNKNPTYSLIPNYKDYLKDSIYELFINKNNFKIVKNKKDVNPIYNGLDFDYSEYLKNKFKNDYTDEIKKTYKLHLILSPKKTMFIYDNVTDTIHHIKTKAAIFNAKDYHDTLKSSYGISIQFPMSPNLFNDNIKKYCELIGIM